MFDLNLHILFTILVLLSLNGVSFDIPKENRQVVGESGCGKSVTAF